MYEAYGRRCIPPHLPGRTHLAIQEHYLDLGQIYPFSVRSAIRYDLSTGKSSIRSITGRSFLALSFTLVTSGFQLPDNRYVTSKLPKERDRPHLTRVQAIAFSVNTGHPPSHDVHLRRPLHRSTLLTGGSFRGTATRPRSSSSRRSRPFSSYLDLGIIIVLQMVPICAATSLGGFLPLTPAE